MQWRNRSSVSFYPISGEFFEATICMFKERHVRLTEVVQIIVARIPHTILGASSTTGTQPLALEAFLR